MHLATLSALSQRQLTLYQFIQSYQTHAGRPPTYAEMQTALGARSKSVVRHHLNVLVKKGYLQREPAIARGVRSAERAERVLVPVLGTLDAWTVPDWGWQGGEPDALHAEAAREWPEMLTLSQAMVPDDPNLYALRVRGESLLDALVYEGDVVVLRPQDQADDQELVLVQEGSRGTMAVRRWYREAGRIRLDAEHPAYPALYGAPEDLVVWASVVAVIRQC